MSLYGAMMTGVAGLTANSQALSVTSANIANVNTVGYKNATVNFDTLLASSGTANNSGSAGVYASTGQNVTQQGLLTTTASATDLAINGSGFFVVTTNPDNTSALEYTRAGSFTTDSTGNLKNAAGLYLLGWQLDGNGNVPSNRNDLTTINVNQLAGKAEASTKMSMQANLQASTTAVGSYTAGDMASGTVTPDFQRTVNVYDSQGGSQPLQLSYVKTAANTWAYEVTYQGAASQLTGPPTNNLLASGTLTFNSDGTLANVVPTGGSGSPVTGTMSVTIPWDTTTSGLQPQTISIDMGTVGGSDGVTQFDDPSTMVSSSVDGALFGSLQSISIDNQGYVTAEFSNGLSQKVYKVPVATFANPNGLAEVSGNAFVTSAASGSPTINEATLGGAGQVESKSLEASTVDLATEFTNLITTQRAYEASSRIVTTASTMLDDLLQIVR
ncbi:MAG: flagellar hook protein FlgE [Alphaproteobacteria bacterium]|nr:flagellar hook protein FlgE [Alphaproteobacteria bacterium]